MTGINNNAWFAPAPAGRIQIIRIITGLFSLWYLVTRFSMMNALAATNPALYKPAGVMQFFVAPPPDLLVTILLVLTIVLNILFIAGWKHTWAGPAFAIMLLFVFCYRNSWSMVYHSYNLMVIHIFILGFASAGGCYSLPGMKIQGWQYGWPLKLMCLATVLVYFLSAVAKLKGDLAWGWLNGSAMRSQIAVDAIRKNLLGVDTSPLFEGMYEHTWMYTIMGTMSLLLELLAPAVLFFNRRVAVAWVLPVWLMHWGIFFLMGITFHHHLTGILYLSFLTPEKWFFFAAAAYNRLKKSLEKVTSALFASTKEYLKQ